MEQFIVNNKKPYRAFFFENISTYYNKLLKISTGYRIQTTVVDNL